MLSALIGCVALIGIVGLASAEHQKEHLGHAISGLVGLVCLVWWCARMGMMETVEVPASERRPVGTDIGFWESREHYTARHAAEQQMLRLKEAEVDELRKLREIQQKQLDLQLQR